MKFLRYDAETGIKSHCVMDSLASSVIRDLERRFNARPIEVAECAAWQWDPGGMCYLDTPDASIEVDGFRVVVDVQFFPEFLGSITQCKAREIDGQTIVKLHGYWQIMAITDGFRDQLAGQAKEIAPTVKEKYEAWLDDYKKRMGVKP